MALIDDFSMWDGDKNVLMYREEKRFQPQGFRPEQLMATALDPRTKILYGIEDNEHEGLWIIVSRRAADIAVPKQARQCRVSQYQSQCRVFDVQLAHAAPSSAMASKIIERSMLQ